MERRMRERGRLSIFVLVAMATVAIAILCAPTSALARSYTMSRTVIDATVTPEGTLHVEEDRTFDFSGHYNGIYYDLPTGYYHGNEVGLEVREVGIVDPSTGTVRPLTLSDSEESGTYEVDDWYSYVRLTIYNQADDQDVTFHVAYDLSNVVVAWSDVGELYWKFVSDGWEEPTHDVTCTIHLPVPAGETVVGGDNVRAWGHGSLLGEVRFQGDDVILTVPEVGTEEYAESRVAFPVSWLTMTPEDEEGLDYILYDEQYLAEEANRERTTAMVTLGLVTGVPLGLSGLTALLAALKRRRYARAHRPEFTDTYWRDVPSDDHPAVIGCLVSGHDAGDREFMATLLRLTDQRVLGLQKVERAKGSKRGSKRHKESFRITTTPKARARVSDPIDRATLEFLFDDIAPKSATAAENTQRLGDDDPTNDLLVLDVEEIRKVANKWPSRYMEALEAWRGTVDAELEAKGYKTDAGGSGCAAKFGLSALAVINLGIGFFGMVVLFAIDAPWWLALIPLAAAIAASIFAFTSLGSQKPLSREGVEVRAKALALKRWLTDFTNLDEAPPTDVVLWNQLFVMAVALDVAEEVLRELKATLPEVVDDPIFYPGMVWYSSYGSVGAPQKVFSDAFSHASTAAVAASSSSSGDGGGGGFSGGGGGGFGGGGGGGAF